MNERRGVNLPPGTYATLGGFLLADAGEIPKLGAVLKVDGISYTVKRSNAQSIQEVRIQRLARRRRRLLRPGEDPSCLEPAFGILLRASPDGSDLDLEANWDSLAAAGPRPCATPHNRGFSLSARAPD